MDDATVADAIADELAQAGVDRVFGLPGGEVLVLMDALRRRGVEFVLCRHEANAGIMAAVYGKLKRSVGVALTTLGPGASNLMLPLANSLLDREPLLAISADLPVSWPLSHTHQRLPLLDVYRPLVKYAGAASGFTARGVIRDALAACRTEPAGPAFVTLSAEAARSLSYEDAAQSAGPPASSGLAGDPARAAAELRRRLAEAERPLVLVGIGARPECAPRLRRWIADWRLPVAVTPKIKGIVDETSEQFVGVISGMAIDALMVEALRSSDLLIGFGLDPVEIDKTWHATLPIVWALESPQATGIVPNENLLAANHDALLDALLAGGEAPREWDDPFAGTRSRRMAYYDAADDAPAGGRSTVAPVATVRALAEVLPPETIVATDVGSHKYLFGQFWPSRQPDTFLMSNGLSGMGYGLAAAIGAKLAHPEAPVLAVLGDGGFSMNSQELETARRVGAPLITVVLADRSYSLIRMAQESRKLPNYGVDFEPIDTVLTARACGVDAVRVESAGELASAVDAAVRDGRALVVEVPIDPEAYRGLV